MIRMVLLGISQKKLTCLIFLLSAGYLIQPLASTTIAQQQPPVPTAGISPAGADDTKPLEFQRIDLGHCASFWPDRSVIIDEKTYRTLIKENRAGSCNSYKLPAIDFTKYTLLGAHLWGGNCSAGSLFNLSLTKDDAKKVYTFAITRHKNPCRGLSYYDFWVLVPRLPSDYTVVFATAEKNEQE
jgi:hypothetical protein